MAVARVGPIIVVDAAEEKRRRGAEECFQAINAAAAAVPAPRAGRHVPLDLAYHPKGLPPAAALPSLTQTADPECKTNLRAQRSFAQVSQMGSWLELMASAAGLEGEVRGTKVQVLLHPRLPASARGLCSTACCSARRAFSLRFLVSSRTGAGGVWALRAGW